MRASEYHKTTARFHGQLAKLHQDHFDGLDDGDPHASFHKAAADLHADHAAFHHSCAKSAEIAEAGLPDAEHLPAGDFRNPGAKAARWQPNDLVPTNVHGPALPDNEDWKKSLEDRGLMRVPRFGGPTDAEIAVQRLDPELRKLVSD